MKASIIAVLLLASAITLGWVVYLLGYGLVRLAL
jgi:hypothetical protein